MTAKPSVITSVRPPTTLNREACFRYCESLVRSQRHNFPIASVFVPSQLRPHIWSVYAFAQTADSVLTMPASLEEKMGAIDEIEDALTRAYFGDVGDNPVMVALMATVKQFELPITEFNAILSGVRSCLDGKTFSTVADLRQHSRLTSSSLVHLLLYMGGHKEETLHRHAIDLGQAVAETKWWQNLAEDRSFLCQEDLHHFDNPELSGKKSDRFIEYLVARSRSSLVKSKPLVDLVGPSLGIEMALFWWGTETMLRKIEQSGANVFHKRPTLSRADKAQIVSKALFWRGGEGVPWRLARHLPTW